MASPGFALIEALRSVPMTYRERHILRCMRDGEELTWAKGGGWWLGLERVGPRVAKRLLCKVYISVTYQSPRQDYVIYTVNEDGLAALAQER